MAERWTIYPNPMRPGRFFVGRDVPNDKPYEGVTDLYGNRLYLTVPDDGHLDEHRHDYDRETAVRIVVEHNGADPRSYRDWLASGGIFCARCLCPWEAKRHKVVPGYFHDWNDKDSYVDGCTTRTITKDTPDFDRICAAMDVGIPQARTPGPEVPRQYGVPWLARAILAIKDVDALADLLAHHGPTSAPMPNLANVTYNSERRKTELLEALCDCGDPMRKHDREQPHRCNRYDRETLQRLLMARCPCPGFSRPDLIVELALIDPRAVWPIRPSVVPNRFMRPLADEARSIDSFPDQAENRRPAPAGAQRARGGRCLFCGEVVSPFAGVEITPPAFDTMGLVHAPETGLHCLERYRALDPERQRACAREHGGRSG